MAKIINVLNENLSDVVFIGRKYYGKNTNIPGLWQQWFSEGLFNKLDNLSIDDSYIGLMKWDPKHMDEYEYWIGVFTNKNTNCVEGYETLEIPNSKLLTFYIKGEDNPELYALEGECFKRIKESNLTIINEKGFSYAFERYNCCRFTKPDENNEVILDYCILVKEG